VWPRWNEEERSHDGHNPPPGRCRSASPDGGSGTRLFRQFPGRRIWRPAMSAWRPAWRELAQSEEIKALEADLDEAESRILGDLASDPTTALIARQVEAAKLPPVQAPVPARPPGPSSRGFRPGGVAGRVSEVIEHTLTIPPGEGSARVVGDQALFGVALPVDKARALLDAWIELMESNDDGDGDGAPPSPEVVAISEFLFTLLDPLAEKLSELP
jgi:hypothetical protein